MSTIINAQDFANTINPDVAQTTINGSTSGSIIASQPYAGTAYKKVVIYCNALDGSATYTFPTPYTYTPDSIVSSSLSSLSVSSLTTTSVMMTTTLGAVSGFLLLEGF